MPNWAATAPAGAAAEPRLTRLYKVRGISASAATVVQVMVCAYTTADACRQMEAIGMSDVEAEECKGLGILPEPSGSVPEDCSTRAPMRHHLSLMTPG